jgi:hypothetical protein
LDEDGRCDLHILVDDVEMLSKEEEELGQAQVSAEVDDANHAIDCPSDSLIPSSVGHDVHRVRPLEKMSRMESNECSASAGTIFFHKNISGDIRRGCLWAL